LSERPEGGEKPESGTPKTAEKEMPLPVVVDSETYPDGYVMTLSADGSYTLSDSKGTFTKWDEATGNWVNQATGKNMPPEWDHYHFPSTFQGSGEK
jgi:hypothetical protein